MKIHIPQTPHLNLTLLILIYSLFFVLFWIGGLKYFPFLPERSRFGDTQKLADAQNSGRCLLSTRMTRAMQLFSFSLSPSVPNLSFFLSPIFYHIISLSFPLFAAVSERSILSSSRCPPSPLQPLPDAIRPQLYFSRSLARVFFIGVSLCISLYSSLFQNRGGGGGLFSFSLWFARRIMGINLSSNLDLVQHVKMPMRDWLIPPLLLHPAADATCYDSETGFLKRSTVRRCGYPFEDFLFFSQFYNYFEFRA